MYIDNIQETLQKELSSIVKEFSPKHKNLYLSSKTFEINNDIISKFIIKNRDNSNDLTTLMITIPYDRKKPATITLTSKNSDKSIENNIGNSRNERLDSDINKILTEISNALKTENPIYSIYEYIGKIFIEKRIKNKTKIIYKDSQIINDEDIDKVVNKANMKGAKILKWIYTQNMKISLIYQNGNAKNFISKKEIYNFIKI